jgi:hypothetical protein
MVCGCLLTCLSEEILEILPANGVGELDVVKVINTTNVPYD